MTKQERREKKLALRAEVRADYNKRFPRLRGKHLAHTVKVKADMLLAALKEQSPTSPDSTSATLEAVETL